MWVNPPARLVISSAENSITLTTKYIGREGRVVEKMATCVMYWYTTKERSVDLEIATIIVQAIILFVVNLINHNKIHREGGLVNYARRVHDLGDSHGNARRVV